MRHVLVLHAYIVELQGFVSLRLRRLADSSHTQTMCTYIAGCIQQCILDGSSPLEHIQGIIKAIRVENEVGFTNYKGPDIATFLVKSNLLT